MITLSNSPHEGAVNDLAARGVIKPVVFEIDGVRHQANCIWAATNWLKAQGLSDAGKHRWIEI